MASKKNQSGAAGTTDASDDGPKFEEGMAELEEMVRRLETGAVPLEESLATFEKGVGLVRLLQTKLDAVQEKIEELTRTSRGEIATVALDVSED
jgi:exodeoxyribonuclease VII small subunit